MAERRMLWKKISLNLAVADLENDTNRLLFTWTIAHLDIKGRITGDPRMFRAAVVPLLGHITSSEIMDFFQDAEAQGLLRRYQVEGEWFIEYPKFLVNQNLDPKREAESRIPDPPELVEASASSQGVLGESSVSPPGELALRLKKVKSGQIKSGEGRLREGSVRGEPQKLDDLNLDDDGSIIENQPATPSPLVGPPGPPQPDSKKLVKVKRILKLNRDHLTSLVDKYTRLTADRVYVELDYCNLYHNLNGEQQERDKEGRLLGSKQIADKWLQDAQEAIDTGKPTMSEILKAETDFFLEIPPV
jgi:hypothetical protein